MSGHTLTHVLIHYRLSGNNSEITSASDILATQSDSANAGQSPGTTHFLTCSALGTEDTVCRYLFKARAALHSHPLVEGLGSFKIKPCVQSNPICGWFEIGLHPHASQIAGIQYWVDSVICRLRIPPSHRVKNRELFRWIEGIKWRY